MSSEAHRSSPDGERASKFSSCSGVNADGHQLCGQSRPAAAGGTRIRYDRVRRLRGGSMAWLARRVDGRIRFVPAQSGEARPPPLQDAGINALDPESFVYVGTASPRRKAARSSPCFASGGLRRLEDDSAAAAAAGATTGGGPHLQLYRRQPLQVNHVLHLEGAVRACCHAASTLRSAEDIRRRADFLSRAPTGRREKKMRPPPPRNRVAPHTTFTRKIY